MRAPIAALLSLACVVPAQAMADTHSPEEIAAHRREILQTLWEPGEGDFAANVRRTCFLGGQPKHVMEDRGKGVYFTPDAADLCVTALTRLGRDRQLPEQYRKLVEAIGGDVTIVATLPRSMSDAAIGGQGTVAVGNGKAANIRPSMAFDAGFTVAFQEGSAVPAGSIDEARLKAVTEACLGDQQGASACASIGYLQGSRAYKQQASSR